MPTFDAFLEYDVSLYRSETTRTLLAGGRRNHRESNLPESWTFLNDGGSSRLAGVFLWLLFALCAFSTALLFLMTMPGFASAHETLAGIDLVVGLVIFAEWPARACAFLSIQARRCAADNDWAGVCSRSDVLSLFLDLLAAVPFLYFLHGDDGSDLEACPPGYTLSGCVLISSNCREARESQSPG